jgi:hypothetical protein
MKKNNVTIDQLATMVKNGFDSTATKSEMTATRSEMHEGFRKANKELRDIKDILIQEHSDKIKYLEKRLRKLEDVLAIE